MYKIQNKVVFMSFSPVFFVRILINNKALLKQLVLRNISLRYKGSLLGFLWTFLIPLIMLSVYTFIFSVVFKSRWNVDAGDNRGSFAIIMFCGISMYNMFSESISSSCSAIVGNPNFVKKVIFPLELLPLAQTISSFIVGLVWFLLVFLGTVFIFGKVGFTMLILPLVLLPLFLFSLGFSYFVASISVYIRDTQYIVGVVLQVLFFMTPVFYPIQAVPEKFRFVLQLNPLAVLIEQARNVFLFGNYPDWSQLGIVFLVSYIVFQLGFIWFMKIRKGFADVL